MGALYLANLSHYLPELVVVITFCVSLLIEATYSNDERHRTEIYLSSFIGLALSFVLLVAQLRSPGLSIFSGAVTVDSFSTAIKMLMVMGTMGGIYLSYSSRDVYSSMKAEFVIMSLGVLVGGMLLASANNFLTVYLGIETLSILSFVMATLKKNDGRSAEAGMKYALYGAFASGISLYGISHLYGLLGSIQFTQVISGLAALEGARLAVAMLSFLMFFAGIGYKIACVPFHMWAPDVYEGSPIPVTTFFALVPKLAGIAVLLRVSLVFFGTTGPMQANWIGLLHVVTALTMTVGNVTAIGQKSVKRMLAYSSISHAGMMMLGVLVISDLGSRAVLFYGLTYVFMTLVAFAVTSFINDKYGNEDHDRFRGLIKRYPLMAIVMSMAMFSLAGLPPLSGFVAKFNILSIVVQKGFYALAFIAVINSVISLYYYMRVVNLMIFKDADANEGIEGFSFVNQSIIFLLSIPILGLGLFWESAMRLAENAKLFIK